MNPTTDSLREATARVWHNNVSFVQLLSLCPLLAVTTTFVNGFALGVMTTLVLLLGNTAMALTGRLLVPAVRIPLYLLLVAALVTALDAATHALLYDLHETLGIFIPLIVVNCGLLAHEQSVASRRSVAFVVVSALATGFGFLFALLVLGALREGLGSGTLFAGAELLRGEVATSVGVKLPFDGMLVAILPPGAFFGMALLLALRNRLAHKTTPGEPALREAPR